MVLREQDLTLICIRVPTGGIEMAGQTKMMKLEAMSNASDSSIATVYYACDSNGKYLGGDVWNEI